MVYPVGIVGDDYQSEQLLSLWNSNVATDFVIRDKSQQITRKTRILAGSFHSFQQQVVRMDYESPISMDHQLENGLAQNIRLAAEQSNALIISDYSLGTLTPGIISKSIQAALDHDIPLIVDSRDHPDIYRGATTVTPNISEVEKTLGKRLGIQDEALDQYGPHLRKNWGVEALLVTRGKLGMSLFTESGIHHYPPFGMDEAVDVTGAGDTVASIYATGIASGLDFHGSALLANIAGGIVVTKKGTATVSTDELRNALEGIK
jgi:D-beta-D-heptose 7-phosphate kinase/D-beta-D-heptose 1-phosphate adenosyltransferase